VLRYKEACCSRSDALIRECAIRLLSRKEKATLVAQNK
jgi:predicted GIY-YIG superfamily endonuclease